MTIKIVLPDEDGVKTCNGTKVFGDKGNEISGVESIKIHMQSGSMLTAEVGVYIGSIDNMDNIHALLCTETLEQVAALHGKKLIDIDGSSLAAIDFKVDFKQVDGFKQILETIAKYNDQLPDGMQEDLKAAFNIING